MANFRSLASAPSPATFAGQSPEPRDEASFQHQFPLAALEGGVRPQTVTSGVPRGGRGAGPAPPSTLANGPDRRKALRRASMDQGPAATAQEEHQRLRSQVEGLCNEVAHSWQRALKAIEAQRKLQEELQHAQACRAAADSACLQLHARVQELENQMRTCRGCAPYASKGQLCPPGGQPAASTAHPSRAPSQGSISPGALLPPPTADGMEAMPMSQEDSWLQHEFLATQPPSSAFIL